MYKMLIKQHTPEWRFFGHGQRREGNGAQPMSEGSGNAEAEGRASKLDSGHAKVVRVENRPEWLLGCKGDDDGVVSDAASAGAGG
jgi:hypothetical protein